MKKTIYSKEHKYLVKQLKKARQKSGFDQTTVAKKLDATQSYISKLESGQHRIDVVQLKELAKIYKKPISHFIK